MDEDVVVNPNTCRFIQMLAAGVQLYQRIASTVRADLYISTYCNGRLRSHTNGPKHKYRLKV